MLVVRKKYCETQRMLGGADDRIVFLLSKGGPQDPVAPA